MKFEIVSDYTAKKMYTLLVQQNDDDNSNLSNNADMSADKKSEDMEDWRNEHGSPSNKYLQGLADKGNMEKLRAIAEDLDAEFSPGDSAEDLIGAIRSATRDDPNTTT